MEVLFSTKCSYWRKYHSPEKVILRLLFRSVVKNGAVRDIDGTSRKRQLNYLSSNLQLFSSSLNTILTVVVAKPLI